MRLKSFLSVCFFSCVSLCADQVTYDVLGNEIRLAVVKSVADIDLAASKNILVRSFMDAYEDVALVDLGANLVSIGDVRRFYETYFDEELEHFKHGGLFWIQAFFNAKLVGWATFESEPFEEEAVYMNLLTVDPEYQQLGIGRKLTFSVTSDELLPNTRAINLLIRKVNTEGYKFYYRLGFFDFDYRRDNFVDTSLLTGLRWEKGL